MPTNLRYQNYRKHMTLFNICMMRPHRKNVKTSRFTLNQNDNRIAIMIKNKFQFTTSIFLNVFRLLV